MIKARLETFLPAGMGMSPLGARAVWDELAQRGILPYIRDHVPYASEPIGWGKLPDGVFFVARMARTESGFTCQITLYPNPVESETLLIFWLERNLFCGKVTGGEDDLFRYTFTEGETGVRFVISKYTITRT